MTEQGGMYQVLKLVDGFLREAEKESFTSKELCNHTSLGKQAVINNLSRLVKIGFLKCYESRKPLGGRIVKYKINGEVIDFIRNSLY